MRILLTLSLLALVASAVMAPRHFNAREGTPDASSLILKDARERAALAEKEVALGTAILAYNEILESDPGDLDAIRGLLRATTRLGAAAPRQPHIAEIIQGVAMAYLKSLPEVDPDGTILQECLTEWVKIRVDHPWYIARAAVGIWLGSRGDPRGYEAIRHLMKLGPFHPFYYSHCQRYFPNWLGVEKHVVTDLESEHDDVRVYAGVTLLLYNRLYGVGEELLEKHRSAIRSTLFKYFTSLVPDEADNSSFTPGGQTILGLALLRDKHARRMIARMTRLEYPHLASVVENARFWTGLDPWEKANFESRRYDHWFPLDHETYYLGVFIAYGDLVREIREATDPEQKRKLEERAKKLSVLIENATYMKMTTVKVMARRALAAIFPERSLEIHRELIDQGGVDSLYGAMALPLEQRLPYLLPALTAGDPDNASLAIVGLLDIAAPVPIQMPARPQ